MNVLITGGAGFIGSNLAARLIGKGQSVVVFDNLSRRGAAVNLAWLRGLSAGFSFISGDVRDPEALRQAMRQVDVVYHLAAQVAVTTSILDPREDFEINARGTFNVLEAARLSRPQPIVFYASTNKVYGGLEHLQIVEQAGRYAFRDLARGVSEDEPLDFHSPYGCSKGAGDQYARDYARIFGLRTIVFRQSCIYGYRQFGVEDQGWLAHFAISIAKNRPVTIFGDGKQVRDVLFVDDLLDAIESAVARIDLTAGKIYNIGGGPDNTLSIWAETGAMLERLCGRPIGVVRGDWRPGDQKIFVSDISRALGELGWKPKVTPVDGLERMWNWIQSDTSLFA